MIIENTKVCFNLDTTRSFSKKKMFEGNVKITTICESKVPQVFKTNGFLSKGKLFTSFIESQIIFIVQSLMFFLWSYEKYSDVCK